MALAALLFFTITNSDASETVTIGPTYPIAESDLLQELKAHLAQKSKNFNIFQAKSLDRPPPVVGLSPAERPRTWDIPWPEHSSIPVQNEFSVSQKTFPPLEKGGRGDFLSDSCRKMKSDQCIGSSSITQLSRQLIFWNGDDKKEQAWVEAHRASWDHPVFILVQGSVSEVSNLLNTKIYFDQNGMLTRRLGIQHTPAIINMAHGKIIGEEVAQ
jgi:hypothetical protein